VIKLGAEGSLYTDGVNEVRQQAFKREDMKIVDTTGAGDCFTAALAVRLMELGQVNSENIKKAMEFASSAAFLCITVKGAMDSMPTRAQVEEFIKL
jgi:ribokinase